MLHCLIQNILDAVVDFTEGGGDAKATLPPPAAHTYFFPVSFNFDENIG